MNCPECGAELSGDAVRCAACGADLADSPAGGIEPGEDVVDLIKTPDIALLLVIKSLLDSARIPYLVQGGEGLHAFPLTLGGGFFNPSAFAAVIRVRPDDFPDAKRLIEETVPPPPEAEE